MHGLSSLADEDEVPAAAIGEGPVTRAGGCAGLVHKKYLSLHLRSESAEIVDVEEKQIRVQHDMAGQGRCMQQFRTNLGRNIFVS